MNFKNDASDMEASNAISAIRSSQTQSQSDARMNLAFFKFEGSIGWMIFFANTLLWHKKGFFLLRTGNNIQGMKYQSEKYLPGTY